MAATAKNTPKVWPTLTTFVSGAFLLIWALYMSKPKIVTEEFRAPLNELKIAPNSTAAKKPTILAGNTCFTSVGYASSLMISELAKKVYDSGCIDI